METQETIREFWFGSHTEATVIAREKSKLWWQKDAQTDATVRQRFEPVVTQAANGELDPWLATPSGRLAMILLTDQFPRNMYRDTPRAFAFDPLAQAWCKEGLALGSDQALRPIERVFFYLPLEHSEALEDQQRAVALFTALMESVGPTDKEAFVGFLDFAIRHRDIIARFGRFPHRNRILGRSSSPEELSFLEQKGSSF